MRGLLNLSEQAQRLISENITADMEVINDVRQIEKVDPARAKETVDALKAASTAKKPPAQRTTKERVIPLQNWPKPAICAKFRAMPRQK